MGNITSPRRWSTSRRTARCLHRCGPLLGGLQQHFDAEEDPGKKLGVFSTGPAIRNYGWNIVTEIIATFVLIFWC